MKLVRWSAAAVLTLMSLMNLGAGTSPDGPGPVVIIAGMILGVAGLVAVYGLLRLKDWGRPAAVGVSALNVIAAVIALVAGTTGAAIGMTVSTIALVLCFLSTNVASAPQSQPSAR